MAITFDQQRHQEMWLLMRDQIQTYIVDKYIPTFYDAETTVDDLKQLVYETGDLGLDDSKYENHPIFYCFACQYAWDVVRSKSSTPEKRERCAYCPLVGWEADTCYMKSQLGTYQEGLFHQLCVAVENKNLDAARTLCERIAYLDTRNGVNLVETPLPESIDIKTIEADSYVISRRENSFTRLTPYVFCLDRETDSPTKEWYINSDGILEVGYRENDVTIANEYDEVVDYIIVDRNSTTTVDTYSYVYGAYQSMTYERIGNFSYLPVTVLVEDTHYSVDKVSGRYLDHSPLFTVAQTESNYTIYNDTDEILAFKVQRPNIAADCLNIMIPTNTFVTLNRTNNLTRRPPLVLVKDEVVGSRTKDKYISSVGLVTVAMGANSILLHNISHEDYNCKVFFVHGDSATLPEDMDTAS